VLLANWQNFTLCAPHTSLCFATPSLATSQLITRALFATRVCSNARRLNIMVPGRDAARAHTSPRTKHHYRARRHRKNFQLIKTNARTRRSKARLCKHNSNPHNTDSGTNCINLLLRSEQKQQQSCVERKTVPIFTHVATDIIHSQTKVCWCTQPSTTTWSNSALQIWGEVQEIY
jgi:hypothetical protein